jgi:hypothetical protein
MAERNRCEEQGKEDVRRQCGELGGRITHSTGGRFHVS